MLYEEWREREDASMVESWGNSITMKQIAVSAIRLSLLELILRVVLVPLHNGLFPSI